MTQLPEVVLYEPEIPPNTGNIIRLCANTGFRLSLIEPLGFEMSAKSLRRAGLDYHEHTPVQIFANFEDYWAQRPATAPLFCCTTKGRRAPSDCSISADASLLFGPESRGLPSSVLERVEQSQWLRLPMRPDSRSMNLSNAVAVIVYESWRQLNFVGSQGPA